MTTDEKKLPRMCQQCGEVPVADDIAVCPPCLKKRGIGQFVDHLPKADPGGPISASPGRQPGPQGSGDGSGAPPPPTMQEAQYPQAAPPASSNVLRFQRDVGTVGTQLGLKNGNVVLSFAKPISWLEIDETMALTLLMELTRYLNSRTAPGVQLGLLTLPPKL